MCGEPILDQRHGFAGQAFREDGALFALVFTPDARVNEICEPLHPGRFEHGDEEEGKFASFDDGIGRRSVEGDVQGKDEEG